MGSLCCRTSTKDVGDVGEGQLGTVLDVIIFVIGPTGTGKSTFINAATEDNSMSVGSGLEPCTKTVKSVRCPLRGDDKGRHVVFVDTPGLDGDIGVSSDIGSKLERWMKKNHVKDGNVAGIIYMHKIDDNRMGNVSISGLIAFTAMFCGGDAPGEKMLLATTMWGQSHQADSKREQREQEIKTKKEYWGGMIENGSDMTRFQNTTESAWEVVNLLLHR